MEVFARWIRPALPRHAVHLREQNNINRVAPGLMGHYLSLDLIQWPFYMFNIWVECGGLKRSHLGPNFPQKRISGVEIFCRFVSLGGWPIRLGATLIVIGMEKMGLSNNSLERRRRWKSDTSRFIIVSGSVAWNSTGDTN